MPARNVGLADEDEADRSEGGDLVQRAYLDAEGCDVPAMMLQVANQVELLSKGHRRGRIVDVPQSKPAPVQHAPGRESIPLGYLEEDCDAVYVAPLGMHDGSGAHDGTSIARSRRVGNMATTYWPAMSCKWPDRAFINIAAAAQWANPGSPTLRRRHVFDNSRADRHIHRPGAHPNMALAGRRQVSFPNSRRMSIAASAPRPAKRLFEWSFVEMTRRSPQGSMFWVGVLAGSVVVAMVLLWA